MTVNLVRGFGMVLGVLGVSWGCWTLLGAVGRSVARPADEPVWVERASRVVAGALGLFTAGCGASIAFWAMAYGG